jgi:hypothetical protein
MQPALLLHTRGAANPAPGGDGFRELGVLDRAGESHVSGPVIHASFVDAIALPRVVRLRPNLIGLAFPRMKLLPARFIVRKALEEGELRPGGLIAATSSRPASASAVRMGGGGAGSAPDWPED